MADSDGIIHVVSPFLVKDIVNKSNYTDHLNSKLVLETVEFPSVSSQTIPVDLSGMKILRSIDVAPGTSVPPHAHAGPTFRFILSGDATVEGVRYEAGDWMIIPAKKAYSIDTENGYRALGFCHMWGVA
jgi:hypothetical protein